MIRGLGGLSDRRGHLFLLPRTWNRISKGYIEPTLTNVVCGDIAMALPERILTNIIDNCH